MKKNFPNWLAPQMVSRIRGFNLDAYLMALEGWRRGLNLKWYLDPSLVTNLKIIGFNPLGKSFSLHTKDKVHYFYRSRGDKVANSAVDIGTNKQLTRNHLIKANVPTPKGDSFSTDSLEKIMNFAKKLGYPLVVKPTFGSLGNGVTTNVNTKNELINSINYVKKIGYDDVIVERYFAGEDYRLYVVNDKVIGATKRVPANVIGDGDHTIEQLVKLKNKQREHNPYLRTKLITIDEELIQTLGKQNLTLETIPAKNKQIYLKSVANIAAGGDPIDVTETLPSSIKKVAVNALASIPGLVHGGVDILVNNNNCTVIEVNPTADISMHIFPIKGVARNIPSSIIDYYFPSSQGMLRDNDKVYFCYRDIRRLLSTGIIQSYRVIRAPIELYAARYIVSGKVQGVSYRRWIKRQAIRSGLHGYTRNLKNGNVVVIVGGEEEKVKAFKEVCQKGSPRSKVRNVKELPWNNNIKTGFEIRNSRF